MKRHLIATLILLAALTCTAGATDWHLNPGDSIQAVIHIASDGDTIHVYNGSYYGFCSAEELNASYNANLYNYYRTFTALAEGTSTYTACTVDTPGTEKRTVTVGSGAGNGWTCPSGCTCFAIGADSRTEYTKFNETLQFIKRYKDDLDFIVYAGDMDSVQINKETYSDVQLNNLPSYWVMGNHEISPGPGVTYIRDLYPCLANTVNMFNDGRNSTYSFEYNDTHVVVIDVYSENADGNTPEGGPQYNWLQSDLALTDKSRQIFVAGHEPAYPQNRHVGDSLDQYPEDRDAFWELLDNYSVEAYFCGHTHYYSRNSSYLNVTQVDTGNMRWRIVGSGDGNSTVVFVAVASDGANSTISVYSSDVEGNDFNLTDEYTINNSFVATYCTCVCGDICVDETGWWRDGGAFNMTGTPIQAAIDNATTGNTIFVYNGTYTENVIVNRSLTLRGESRDAVTVQANDSDNHVFNVTADMVNISGFTVTGVTGKGKAGMCLNNADYCNIFDNNFSNNCNGIYLLSSCEHNTLHNNTVNRNEDNGIYLSRSCNNMLLKNVISKGVYGIHLAYSSNHNTITENVVNLCSSNGIDMTDSDSNQITKNKLNSSTNCGIRMHRSDSNIVADNSFNDNKYGIFTYRSHNNVLTNNTASDNEDDGILLNYRNDGTRVTNNTLVNNTNGITLRVSCTNMVSKNNANRNKQYGIYLWASSNDNTLTNNTVTDNNYGIFLNSSSDNWIYNNYLDNIQNAADDGTNIWNITNTTGSNIMGGPFIGGNYWSDYGGVDVNRDGFGDMAYPIGSNYDYLPLVPLCGDLDGNMLVDATDLQLLLDHVFTDTPINECAGDVDGNGNINIMDVRLLMNHITNPAGYPLNGTC